MEDTSQTYQGGLRLSDELEFLGQYQNSGLKDPPYLIRRADGHTLQVSRLVYLVAEAIRRYGHPDAVADEVTRRYGREVSAENILYLVEHKLGPIGIVPANDPEATPPSTANPLLALRLRVPLLPARSHRLLTAALRPLFWPPAILASLIGLVAVDIWLFTTQQAEVLDGMQTVLFEPRLLLGLTLMTLVAGAFHEIGHASAARYGGARPGAMGAGVYIVWPVFYTDVSDTYRLDRRSRLRTDLGGVYFNVLFTLGTAGAFAATGFSPLLVLAVVVQLETLRQFLPFIRLDGYHVMSDLAGVPNLFSYMGPVLTVLVRRRDSEALTLARHKLAELTRRARTLIVGWVLITAPVLAVNVVLFAIFLPRLAGMAWGSAAYQVEGMTTSTGAITPVGLANGVISLVLLALPVAGMSYLLGMILRRGGRQAVRWWPQRPAITAAATGTVALALVAQVGLAWPGAFTAAVSQARGFTGEQVGRPLDLIGGELPPGLLLFVPTQSPPAVPISNDGGPASDTHPAQAAPAPAVPMSGPAAAVEPTPSSPGTTVSGAPGEGADDDVPGVGTTLPPAVPPVGSSQGDGDAVERQSGARPGEATSPSSPVTVLPPEGDDEAPADTDEDDRRRRGPLSALAEALGWG